MQSSICHSIQVRSYIKDRESTIQMMMQVLKYIHAASMMIQIQIQMRVGYQQASKVFVVMTRKDEGLYYSAF